MTSFRLTPLALRDLKAIARYTARTGGVAQSRTYRARLDACIDAICIDAIVQGRAHARAAGGPGNLLRSRCQRHTIFFRRGAGAVEIVAILHTGMDCVAQLAARGEAGG